MLKDIFEVDGNTLKSEIKHQDSKKTDSPSSQENDASFSSDVVRRVSFGTKAVDVKEGHAWSKLMNLLMQLRKVCDQYPSLTTNLPTYLPCIAGLTLVPI